MVANERFVHLHHRWLLSSQVAVSPWSSGPRCHRADDDHRARQQLIFPNLDLADLHAELI